MVGHPDRVGNALRTNWRFGPDRETDFVLRHNQKVRSLYAFATGISGLPLTQRAAQQLAARAPRARGPTPSSHGGRSKKWRTSSTYSYPVRA
jgi:hypothetical protein